MSRNYQPRGYMQMLKREGRFRLLKSNLSKDIRVWHNCESYGDRELEKNKTIWQVDYGNWYGGEVRWNCTMCGEDCPEGIAGLYIMLDWDRATEAIANATDTSGEWTHFDEAEPF